MNRQELARFQRNQQRIADRTKVVRYSKRPRPRKQTVPVGDIVVLIVLGLATVSPLFI